MFLSIDWEGEGEGKRVEINEFRANLHAVHNWCNQNNSKLILLTYPIKDQDCDVMDYNHELLQYASNEHLHFIDINREIRNMGDSGYLDDLHPSRLGHKKIAELIGALIEKDREYFGL